MKRSLLILIFSVFFSMWGYSQSNELIAYADGIEYSNPWDGGIPGQDEGSVIFYPNPVKTTLSVRFPEKGTHVVRVYNIVGEKIAEKSVLDDDVVKLNLSDINNGVYFLSYEFKGKVVTKTFSKTQ